MTRTSATSAAYSASIVAIATTISASVVMSIVASVGCTAMQGLYRSSTPVYDYLPRAISVAPVVARSPPYLGCELRDLYPPLLPVTLPRSIQRWGVCPPLRPTIGLTELALRQYISIQLSTNLAYPGIHDGTSRTSITPANSSRGFPRTGSAVQGVYEDRLVALRLIECGFVLHCCCPLYHLFRGLDNLSRKLSPS